MIYAGAHFAILCANQAQHWLSAVLGNVPKMEPCVGAVETKNDFKKEGSSSTALNS